MNGTENVFISWLAYLCVCVCERERERERGGGQCVSANHKV